MEVLAASETVNSNHAFSLVKFTQSPNTRCKKVLEQPPVGGVGEGSGVRGVEDGGGVGGGGGVGEFNPPV